MGDAALQMYHSLPSPVRSLVATMYGARLRAWRYGSETETLVSEALARDYWDAEKWKTWQENQLGLLLHRAVTKVPFYRDLWTERRRRGDRSSCEYLENWPILEKESLRRNPRAFLADDCNFRRMRREHTSGTTGKSLQLWRSKQCDRGWYALFEARTLRWQGLSRNDRWAIFGGQLVTPVKEGRPPFWVWNAAVNQLYMSSYHLAPDLVPYYLKALKHYRITYLLGYTSALHTLAQEILRLGNSDIELSMVITNAEPVFEHQRDVISQAFQCPLRETYGMAEISFAASECGAGRLHTWPEVGIGEIMQGNELVADGQAGDLICTGLMNLDMPLIRYRVGDRGTFSSDQRMCECGRLLPQMDSIEGRADDVLYSPDGRLIGRLDPVFKGNLPVREAQIIQETLNRVRLRFVPAPDYRTEDGKALATRIRERMGSVEVILEAVNEIPRSANGKFRAVICNLPSDKRLQLHGRKIAAGSRN